MDTPIDIAFSVIGFILSLWWIFAFFVLLPLAKSTWLFWRQCLFKKATTYILLEIRIPREIRKSPRAMEQVLNAIHSFRNAPGDIEEKWWDGEITRRYSFEVASFGGEIHFYVRCYYKQRSLVEAAFFSYYPDLEIVEVEDYVERFPKDAEELDAQGYAMWGSEMILKREGAYPIRTYLDFESPDEEKEYDPMSAFLEVLAKCKREEIVGIQIVTEPAPHTWKDKYVKLVEDLKQPGKSDAMKKKRRATSRTAISFPGGPLPAFEATKVEPERDMMDFTKAFMRTPGETDVLKAIENNLSKVAFNTIIRFIYLSPKPLFYDSFARRAITGAFNQYAALDLNSFVRNEAMSTRIRVWHWPHMYPSTRTYYRMQRLLWDYPRREMPEETFMGKVLTSHPMNWNFATKTFEINSQCLATLFHPPTRYVLTAPHVPRVETKKGGPPAGLAIFGTEKDIERF